MEEVKNWQLVRISLGVPHNIVDDQQCPSERKKKHVMGNYYIQTSPHASWLHLAVRLYWAGEFHAVEKAKQHLPKSMWRLNTVHIIMLSALSSYSLVWLDRHINYVHLCVTAHDTRHCAGVIRFIPTFNTTSLCLHDFHMQSKIVGDLLHELPVHVIVT